jgi:hypothetical protein
MVLSQGPRDGTQIPGHQPLDGSGNVSAAALDLNDKANYPCDFRARL